MDEKNIPQYILQIMYAPKTMNFNTSIEQKYKLSENQIQQLAILEEKILYKELTLADFLGAIKTKLNLDDKTTNSIAFDVCQNLFLSAQPYLIGVQQLMARLKPEQVPPQETKSLNVVNLKNLPKP